jgi:DnaJ-class molecular chaperone
VKFRDYHEVMGLPRTAARRRLFLRDRGLPRPDGTRGGLYAVVRIVVPDQPSAAERKAYEALERDASAAANGPAGG